MTIGKCKHGDFNLVEGCPLCVAVREYDELAVKVKEKLAGEPELPSGGLAQAARDAGAEVKIVEMTMELEQRPGADTIAHGYYLKAKSLLEYAEKRQLRTLQDNQAANNDLSIISILKKQMEKKKKEYLGPLKEEADAIRETYNLLMEPVVAAEKITKDKMLAYNAELERRRKEEEDINRKRMEAAEAEMRLKGEITESVNLVEVSPEPPKSVSTQMGISSQRENWKYEVTDFALVPDEYKMINFGVLTPAVKSFKDKRTIPGVRIYNKMGISTRRRSV